MKNEDLNVFSPIDEYMHKNYDSAQGEGEGEGEAEETKKKADSGSEKSQDSRESVPGLTGNTQIIMRRDFDNKYELEQNGKLLELTETHF